MIVSPPEFILDLGAKQEKLRFTVGRLEHMTRSTMTVKDRTTKRVRTFEGVDFLELILAKGSELEVLEVSYGFFRNKKIPGRELDGNSKVVVADTVDGKTLSGSAPFRLVIELRQGDIQLFSHATGISMRPPP